MSFLFSVFALTIAGLASRIRNQTPSWSRWEPLRAICPEGKGKGRCYDFCHNHGTLVNVTWLDEHCLPNLQYDDAFIIERRREFVPRWAIVAATLTDPPRYYLDIRNTTFREEVLEHPEHVVRLLAVSYSGKGILDRGATVFYDATSLTDEQKVFEETNGQYMIHDLHSDIVTTLPTVLHPQYPTIYSYALGLARYGHNLTQALIWHGTDFPDEIIMEINTGSYTSMSAPFFDVTEHVWVRQTDKCQPYHACDTCLTQVNCDWCLLANHTYGCVGFCTDPWREQVCGANPIVAAAAVSLVLFLSLFL
eukprot:Gregarina_sp_Pseudo_9__1288@NODE_185_length_3754_cov_15_688829_g170_i0_p3_GENE_NODE_185_length_3754_cov_15_688829_g170_i0NODE_185_length_3754_cov_15_688829_g170_i0_p3_ORF_typecomplete_len307_score45_70AMIN/PF11741_8/0_07_NODE_185_length_3754_cov_15_688829_g170_i04291349